MNVVILPKAGGALLSAIGRIPEKNRHWIPGIEGIFDDRTLTLYTSDECEIEDRRGRGACLQ